MIDPSCTFRLKPRWNHAPRSDSNPIGQGSLFIVLGLWVAFDAASTTSWDAIYAYAGNKGVATMSMGVGLTVVIALFIDAGTVSADFNRWAADRKSSLLATFSAFPVSNLVAMLVGRSRYAEESPTSAARIMLHLHSLIPEGVILQYFVRINQHEEQCRRAL